MKTDSECIDTCRVRLTFPSTTSDLGSSLEKTDTTTETNSSSVVNSSEYSTNLDGGLIGTSVDNDADDTSDQSNEVLSVLAPPVKLSTTLLEPVEIGNFTYVFWRILRVISEKIGRLYAFLAGGPADEMSKICTLLAVSTLKPSHVRTFHSK